MAFTNQMGFTARVLLVHDKHGQLKLNEQELRVFERTVKKLPKSWMDFSGYRNVSCATGRRRAGPAAVIFISMNLAVCTGARRPSRSGRNR